MLRPAAGSSSRYRSTAARVFAISRTSPATIITLYLVRFLLLNVGLSLPGPHTGRLLARTAAAAARRLLRLTAGDLSRETDAMVGRLSPAIEFDRRSGHQTITEDTDATVALATLGQDRSIGQFHDRAGRRPDRFLTLRPAMRRGVSSSPQVKLQRALKVAGSPHVRLGIVQRDL